MSSLVPLQISPELINTYRIIKLFLSSHRDFPSYLVFSSFTAQIAGLLFLWFRSLSPSKRPFMWVLSVGHSDFSLNSISTFKFLSFWYLKTCSLSFLPKKDTKRLQPGTVCFWRWCTGNFFFIVFSLSLVTVLIYNENIWAENLFWAKSKQVFLNDIIELISELSTKQTIKYNNAQIQRHLTVLRDRITR